MNIDDLLSFRTSPKSISVIIFLSIALASFIAIAGNYGYPYLVLLLLVVFSIPGILFPLLIPITAILVSPLIGQITNEMIGPLNAIGILSLWMLYIGGMIVIINIEKVLKNKLVIVAILLVVLSVLSVIPSNSKSTTLAEALRMASAMVMLPLVIVLTPKQQHRKLLIAALLFAAILPLLIGAYQKITGDLIIGGAVLTNYERETGLIRIYSTFYDAHPFAKYLIVILSLLFALIIERRKKPLAKYIYLVLFGFGVIELIFTYTRGQLISVFVSFIIIFYAAGKLSIKIALISTPFILGLFWLSGVFQRFSDLIQPGSVAPGLQPNSFIWRLGLWERAIPLSLSRPLLGHGLGTFDAALGIIAHNDYLGFFYELGIGGLLLYISFLIIALRINWRFIRSTERWNFDRIIALAGLGATAAIAVSSIAENIFTSTTMWWNYMVILGCVISADREVKRKRFLTQTQSEQ